MAAKQPETGIHVEHFEKGVRYTSDDLLLLARKIGKLATYCKSLRDPASSIRVEAERRETKKERDQVKVMVNVHLPMKTFRAESRRPTAIDALDRCIEKLEPQIKRFKEKAVDRKKHMSFAYGKRARPASGVPSARAA